MIVRRYSLFIAISLMIRISEANKGIMLLYRPTDSTNECTASERLRYDISFGMGMSDTITLVFRNILDLDYACEVEIVSDDGQSEIFILVVISYPKPLVESCYHNPRSFTAFRDQSEINLCRAIGGQDPKSRYYTITTRKSFNFKFCSNSSVDREMNAYHYEVTATSARMVSQNQTCHRINETICIRRHKKFCFTSGTVCDGIKNCGIPEWYDEASTSCYENVERLSAASILVSAFCLVGVILLGAHLIHKCIPQVTSTFFIYNAREDNRIYIDPVMRTYSTSRRSPSIERNQMISGATETSIESIRKEAVITKKLDDVPNRKETALVWVTHILRSLQESFKTASGRSKSTPDGAP